MEASGLVPPTHYLQSRRGVVHLPAETQQTGKAPCNNSTLTTWPYVRVIPLLLPGRYFTRTPAPQFSSPSKTVCLRGEPQSST